MATDLTVILENRPGTIADMGEALGKAGLNIEGSCGFPCEGAGIMHILVDDASAARKVLEESNFEVKDEREVLVVDVITRPGGLGEIARKIADAGVNLDLVYLTEKVQFVLGVDDLEKAKQAL